MLYFKVEDPENAHSFTIEDVDAVERSPLSGPNTDDFLDQGEFNNVNVI